jgi:hypothetical protein
MLRFKAHQVNDDLLDRTGRVMRFTRQNICQASPDLMEYLHTVL